MFFKTLIPAFALGASAELIVGLGSSYAEGPGLDQRIGDRLRQKLADNDGSDWTFTNVAVSGSTLGDIVDDQAPKLDGTNPRIAYIVSGGNDLSYATCLSNPSDDACQNSISEDEWKQRYRDVLDSVIQHTDGDRTIFCVTYIRALGANTECPSEVCPMSAEEKEQNDNLYNRVVDYTVNAIDEWKATGENGNYDVRMIPMRQYSEDHYVGTDEPWINGAQVPDGAGGITWHPNNAGADAVAQFLFESFTG
ncbi:SGNH hydrolase [Sarocladium strictum]